jgi:pimeloyl-ACP methyl ester carboxylesterase
MRVNGHKLFVIKRVPADGPAVILLHHGLGSTRAWRRQLHPLVEAGFHVIAYDRWGYGKSDPRPQFSMPFFDDDQLDLLALMDQLKLDQAALVGHSDGATIALYFAAAYPERVVSLITIAAHIYVEEKTTAGILGVRQTYQNDAEFLRRFQRTQGEKYQQVFENWFYGWSKAEHLSWDMRPALRKVRCPVLVVQGLEDEHATPRHAQDLAAALPDAELWILPQVGHMVQRDAARGFNERMIDFLRRTTIDEYRSSFVHRLSSTLE